MTIEKIQSQVRQSEIGALEIKVDALTQEKAALLGQISGLMTERDVLKQLVRTSPVQQRKLLEQIEAIDVHVSEKEAELENIPEGLTAEERGAVQAVRTEAIDELKAERERLRLLIVGEKT